ncbi:MAG TPA: hypothetical protein VFQ87_13860 [Bradyrhizobium sp.]|jgi:hypothetical protein|nr:hypothetical protein [Bradyrhizobium sp.]
MVQVSDDGFNSPGQVGISPAALAEARKFAAAVGALNHGALIVGIDWAFSIVLQDPGQPEQKPGACLMIGAYRRDQVPEEFINVIDGLELAFKIPDNVWPPGAQRIVDVDKTQLFGFALR